MGYLRGSLLCLLLITCFSPGALAQTPTRESAQANVEQLLVLASKSGVTLGLIRDVVEESISFGAPAYNGGDVKACAEFYQRNTEGLVRSRSPKSTPGAALALDQLDWSLRESKRGTDSEQQAWLLRFAFDYSLVLWETHAARGSALVRLGGRNFQASRYAVSSRAFQQASDLLEEVAGTTPIRVSLELRLAPLLLADSLFSEAKYSEATAAVTRGLSFVPDWPLRGFNPRTAHPKPDEYDGLLSALEAEVGRHPKAADLQFLLGYEYYMAGRRAEGIARFKQALKLTPGHPSTLLFLSAAKAHASTQI